jgi:hypothetical protein
MKFIERLTVSSRVELGVGEFLFSSEIADAVCHEQDCSPGALILDNLVANRNDGEAFEEWLCRQVREIIVLHVQTDDWQGEEGAWTGIRTQRVVEGIALDGDDRAWLMARYGRHPEVMAVWEEACRRDHIQQLAA